MTTVDIKSIAPETDFEALHRTFSAFKEANDQRLLQIEHRLCADVITEEKLQRIDDALNETKRRLDLQAIERSRPQFELQQKSQIPVHEREHKAAFRAYARSGDSEGLKAIEEKAMSIGSGPDGGYLVPVPAEAEILRRLAMISPIRQIASVRQISTATYKKAFAFSGPAAGWVAEADARPQSANQQIADMSFPAMELYAMPAATQTLLDDAAIDVEQWIAEEIDKVFAEQEGAAFVNGNGVNKPMGILAYPKVLSSAWSWGKTGYLVTGNAGAFATTAPSDILFDLIYSVRAGYRQNGRFVMNRKVQSIIRKFRAATGEYLWTPPASPGAPASLMNFPLTEAEDMPDIAADAFSIAFGDFQRGYLIVDRMGIRVLRDPYSAKPYILFYTTKRVGGGIQDFDAFRLIKFGTA
jgi:HK97 family phage major capsid protein